MAKFMVAFHSALRVAVIVPEGEDPPAGFKDAGWFNLDDPKAKNKSGEPIIIIRAKKVLRIFGFADGNGWDVIDWEAHPDHELPEIPPGVNNDLPHRHERIDNTLPVPPTPGVPVQGLPDTPDNSLPDEQPYPDQGLPAGGAQPDQGLPGQPNPNPNLNPDLDPNLQADPNRPKPSPQR
jgi:hypothetical protein